MLQYTSPSAVILPLLQSVVSAPLGAVGRRLVGWGSRCCWGCTCAGLSWPGALKRFGTLVVGALLRRSRPDCSMRDRRGGRAKGQRGRGAHAAGQRLTGLVGSLLLRWEASGSAVVASRQGEAPGQIECSVAPLAEMAEGAQECHGLQESSVSTHVCNTRDHRLTLRRKLATIKNHASALGSLPPMSQSTSSRKERPNKAEN